MILLDIETGPQDDIVYPEFTAPANYKDPEKIEANIEKQKAEYRDKAALNPAAGKIVSFATADSYHIGDFESYGAGCGESELIKAILEILSDSVGGSRYTVGGWNIKGFDLPFIIRRAWALGIKVPFSLMPTGKSRFYWPNYLIDLRDIWGLGEYMPKGSLDDVATLFGIPSKAGKGADFYKLYANPETRAQAIEYQRSEMAICIAMCERWGL